MPKWPLTDIDDLISAHLAWPEPSVTKEMQVPLLLRIRIERIVRALPTRVIAARPDCNYVRRRLSLSVGEPGLDLTGQRRRRRIVSHAIAAYGALCDVLHGRRATPTHSEITAWEAAVAALEAELSPSLPQQQSRIQAPVPDTGTCARINDVLAASTPAY